MIALPKHHILVLAVLPRASALTVVQPNSYYKYLDHHKFESALTLTDATAEGFSAIYTNKTA